MPILAPTPLQQRLVFWTVFVVLLLVSAASFVTTQRLVTLSENAERSQDTLLELERFLSHVKDVETGEPSRVTTSLGELFCPTRQAPKDRSKHFRDCETSPARN